MVHVGNVAEALSWYQRAFPHAVRKQVATPEFEYLAVGLFARSLFLRMAKLRLAPAGLSSTGTSRTLRKLFGISKTLA